jgi:hypothetical protein
MTKVEGRMKKMLMALCASVLLVGSSFANGYGDTTVYKLTGNLAGYAGVQKSGLPKTAYLIADTYGSAYIIWYWIENGHKYMSEPLCVWAGEQNETGPSDEFFYWETALHRDPANLHKKAKESVANLGYNQTAYGSIEMVGAGFGEGTLPLLLTGSYYNEVVENDYYYDKANIGSYDEFMGFGIGTCVASYFKFYSESSALDVVEGYWYMLQSKGYMVPEDGSAVYQDI